VKKSSNSDGQEVHKYQQNNHLSTQFIEHKKDQEVLVLVWDIHNIMYEVHVIYYRISLNNEKSPLCVLAWLWGYGV
jgi:hypothetical protein